MKKTICFFIMITFLFSQKLFSEALFTPDQNEVKELTTLYTKAGRTLPANAFPVRRGVLIEWAEALYETDLSKQLSIELSAYIDKIVVLDSTSTAELDWSTGYEYYFKSEYIPLDETADYLAEMPLGIIGGSFVDYEYGGACLELLLKREYSENPDSNFFISEPNNPLALENQIVSKGYVFFSNDFLQVVIGRLPLHYGDPRFNSLMANKNLPFLDQVRMDMNISNFSLEYYAATLENRRCADDLDLSGTDYSFSENSIWTMMHRLAYSFNSVRISLSEQSFISRINNQFYLGDFIPLTVWHNTWLSNINISMFVDINWTIFSGMEIYFQWGFDDINASEVFGIGDSSIPTIDSFILGLSYADDINKLPYELKLEIGKTHYLWGSFDASNPLEEAIYRVYLDSGNRLIPFSSPYGPGAFWIELDSGIETSFGLSGGLVFKYLNINTLADIVTTSYEKIG